MLPSTYHCCIYSTCSQMSPSSCHMEAVLLQSPPQMDLTKYGWKVDHQGILLSWTVPPDTLPAPPDMLRLIRCNCKTSECRTTSCSCSKLGCTIFCSCEGGEIICKNPHTQNQSDDAGAFDNAIEDINDIREG